MNEVSEERVTITNNGKELAGVVAYPEIINHRIPGAILLHGFTSDRNESPIVGHGETMFQRAVGQLVAAGFATLRFDFNGHGESSGLFENITIDNLIDDALAAVQFFTAVPEIAVDQIGLLGQSMGGLVAACTAHRDKRIRATALWNAPSIPLCTWWRGMGSEMIDKVMQTGVVEFLWENEGPYRLRRTFFDSIIKMSPLTEIFKFSGPLLVVVGTNDEYVFPQPQMGEAFLCNHNGIHELLVLETDHTFNISIGEIDPLDKAIQKTIEWFKKAL